MYSPVHEGALGVHEVELVIQSRPRFCNGRRVAQHAHSPLHLCEVSTWSGDRIRSVTLNDDALIPFEIVMMFRKIGV